MGSIKDYPNVSEWKSGVIYNKDGKKRELVKYQGNIFVADWWSGSAPGVNPKHVVKDKDGEDKIEGDGWELYDELYDDEKLKSSPPTEHAKIIAYIPTWRKSKGFDYANNEIYRYITHGIISFLKFSESETHLGEFEQTSLNDVKSILPEVVETGHRNGTKILIALGGATDYGFLDLMTSIGKNRGSPLLDRAVQNVVKFVKDNDLDGVDLDLECWWDKNGNPRNDQGGRGEAQRAHPAGYGLTEFARKLREAMPDDKIVSAAFFASSWYGNNYELIEHVNWIGVMTYDLTGSWNNSPIGPHTALYKIRDQKAYEEEQQGSWPLPNPESRSEQPMRDNPIQSVEEALWYWTNPFFVNWQGAGQNMPREKFVGGVPLYGYDFARGKDEEDREKDAEGNKIGPIPPGYKTIQYKDILKIKQKYPKAHVENGNIKVPGNSPRPSFISARKNYPYLHNIYYETPETAVKKLNFLKSVGAQGVIIWELSGDVWEEGKSIVKALYRNRNSGNPPKTVPILKLTNTSSSLKLRTKNRLFFNLPTDWLSDLKISGSTLTFSYHLSAKPYYQWWVLYQGVMPVYAYENTNKLYWDWLHSHSKTEQSGTISYDYPSFKPGAIYTLALFKDESKDAYDLADYIEFTIPLENTDYLSNLWILGSTLTFSYHLSAKPYYQWWVLYQGVMPFYAYENTNKLYWDWLHSHSKTEQSGTISYDYPSFKPGAIYTLALFKDESKDAYDLADYIEFTYTLETLFDEKSKRDAIDFAQRVLDEHRKIVKRRLRLSEADKTQRSAITNLIAFWDDHYLQRDLNSGTIVSGRDIRGYRENARGRYAQYVQSARIDNQGLINRDGIQYANIQVQLGSDSFANALVPTGYHIGRRKIRRALIESLDRNAQSVIVPPQNAEIPPQGDPALLSFPWTIVIGLLIISC